VGGIGINRGIILVLDIIAANLISTKAVNKRLMFNETRDLQNMSKEQTKAFVAHLQKIMGDMYDVSHIDVVIDEESPEETAVLLKKNNSKDDKQEYVNPETKLVNETEGETKTEHTD